MLQCPSLGTSGLESHMEEVMGEHVGSCLLWQSGGNLFPTLSALAPIYHPMWPGWSASWMGWPCEERCMWFLCHPIEKASLQSLVVFCHNPRPLCSFSTLRSNYMHTVKLYPLLFLKIHTFEIFVSTDFSLPPPFSLPVLLSPPCLQRRQRWIKRAAATA